MNASPDPVEWIRDVLGVELWDTQKHIIAAMDKSPRPLCAIQDLTLDAKAALLDRWVTMLCLAHQVYGAHPIADINHWAGLFNRQATAPKFYWFGSDPPKWFQAYAKYEAEQAKWRVININSRDRILDRLSADELVVVDEAARMTPFDRDACAAAFEALRPRNNPVKVHRPPLHNPKPWNPPTAKRRKR